MLAKNYREVVAFPLVSFEKAFMSSLFSTAKPAVVEMCVDSVPGHRSRLGADGVERSVFKSGDTISGSVKVCVMGAKRLEHAGVRIELRGVINARGEKAPHDFVSLVQELAPPGGAQGITALPFSFPFAILPNDSYAGALATVRYFLRAIVTTKGGFAGAGVVAKDLDLYVENYEPLEVVPSGLGGARAAAEAGAIDLNAAVKLEVGIEDCLHIEFEYNK